MNWKKGPETEINRIECLCGPLHKIEGTKIRGGHAIV